MGKRKTPNAEDVGKFRTGGQTVFSHMNALLLDDRGVEPRYALKDGANVEETRIKLRVKRRNPRRTLPAKSGFG